MTCWQDVHNDEYYEEPAPAKNFKLEKVSMDERRDNDLLEQLEREDD